MFVVAVMVACRASNPPVVANHAAGPPPAPPDPTPSAMCARLGAELGPLGGPTGGGGPVAREHAIAVMCTKRGWSDKVLGCVVDSSRNDPMSCLRRPFLTDEQNAQWNETFNAWFL